MSILSNQRIILSSSPMELKLLVDEVFYEFLGFMGYTKSEFEPYAVGHLPEYENDPSDNTLAQFDHRTIPKTILIRRMLESYPEQAHASLFHEFVHFHDWVFMEQNHLVSTNDDSIPLLFSEHHAYQIEFCYLVDFDFIDKPRKFSFSKEIHYINTRMSVKDLLDSSALSVSSASSAQKILTDIAFYTGCASVLKRYCTDVPKEYFACPQCVMDVHPRMGKIWSTLVSSFHPYSLSFIKPINSFEKSVRKTWIQKL